MMRGKEKSYPLIRTEEIEAGVEFLRKSKKYASFAPLKDQPKVDIYLLRVIANEVARRRTVKSKLMFLTGTVVREYVPDVDKTSRDLGNAYKAAMSRIYNDRKLWQRIRHEAEVIKKENPIAPPPAQFRLL